MKTSYELVSEGDRNSERLRGGGGIAEVSHPTGAVARSGAMVVATIVAKSSGLGIAMDHGKLNRSWSAIAGAVIAIVLGVGVLPSSPVAAGAILSVGPTFPTSVTVGQTGIAASITITNNNTAPEVASTVCRHDDSSSGPFAECFGAEGIVLTPSCGAQDVQFVFCTAPGADPGVFLIHPTAVGSGACLGLTFTAVPLNDTFGRYRFDPPSGGHVVLPTPGSACTIDFTFDVLKMPTRDRQAAVAGIQTAQIALASVEADTGALGAGQGTTTPVSILPAVPGIGTNASSGFVVGGGQLGDFANVTGLVGASPGGTVSFRLYGPNDATCTGAVAFTDTQPLVVGADPTAGSAQSALFTPTDAGTYRWIATYNGDVNNAAVSGPCGDATETRVVAQTTPLIATTASPGVVLGAGQLSDQATVSGLVNPLGPQTVTFQLFGPTDPTCVGAIFTSTAPLTNGVAQSALFTPTVAGTYRWIATYNGDVNNAVVSGSCGDPTETHSVAPATPSIATVASPNTALGVGQLSDQATVTGRVNPSGPQTVTFDLFAPTDPTCAGTAIFTSTVALSNGTATSASFTPIDVGTYRWIATYDGDENNVAATGNCGDPTETVVVAQATPLISTTASPGVVLGAGQLSDQATVTGRVNPIGAQTVTFDLFAPADPTCAGTAIFTSTVALTNGAAQSAAFTPLVAGTYRWIATYAGDGNNTSVRGSCGDTGETVAVARAAPSIVTDASAGVVAGGGVLTDHATVTGLVNPAGPQTVTFGLFGPSDTNCTATPLFTSTVPLTNGAAESGPYAPSRPGTYRWLATYDGDVNNAPVSGRCNDATETRIVASPPAALPPTGARVSPTLTAAICAIAAGLMLIGSTRRRRVGRRVTG